MLGGDGRAALNISLELACHGGTRSWMWWHSKGNLSSLVTYQSKTFLRQILVAGLPYDKAGDMHYDIISAFIKSMRGSDPDAALYWLARMIDAGEDPKVYCAAHFDSWPSEDIGNADPEALLIADMQLFGPRRSLATRSVSINLAQAVAVYGTWLLNPMLLKLVLMRRLHEVRTGPRREVPKSLARPYVVLGLKSYGILPLSSQ